MVVECSSGSFRLETLHVQVVRDSTGQEGTPNVYACVYSGGRRIYILIAVCCEHMSNRLINGGEVML